MFEIAEELKKLPDQPGVYIMHDSRDAIIYIGKLSALENGCTSIFRQAMMRGSKSTDGKTDCAF